MKLRPLALLATVAGIVVTLVALTQLSWVHLEPVRGAEDHSSWVILWDDPKGRHTTLVWVLFVACAVTALVAGWTDRTWSLLLRCVAPLLAGALVVVMAWQVFMTDTIGNLPEARLWVDTQLAAGFWTTLLGLVLVALGSAFGARRRA